MCTYTASEITVTTCQGCLTSELRALQGAWATPSSSRMVEKTERSSARSIWSGLVPRMFTPFRWSGMAWLLGICPPTETMQPVQPCGGQQEELTVLVQQNALSWERRAREGLGVEQD